MPAIWRLAIVIYNLLLIVIAGGAISLSLGKHEPMNYINMAFSTSQNRMVTGMIALLVAALALTLLILVLRRPFISSESVSIDENLLGDVSMSIAAIKVIIMKAVRQVSGIKDIRPVIIPTENGLVVRLHMMINPECSVPEMCRSVQNEVKEYLENIGGLQVAEIKVLVDDFKTVNK